MRAGTTWCPIEGPLLLQISQLNSLITLLIGNLSAGDRMKIMTICTIDVHARDVVAKMITAKARVRGQGGGPQALLPPLPGAVTLFLAAPPLSLPEVHPCPGRGSEGGSVPGAPGGPGDQLALHWPCRWRAPRPSPGSPSCGIAGTKRRSTASPTSATPRSSTRTSTWATRRGWSSPRSRTGADALPARAGLHAGPWVAQERKPRVSRGLFPHPSHCQTQMSCGG